MVGFLALAALWVPCRGAEPSQALTDRMEQFRQEYGLHEKNFSICYYNTVTGEEYRWNDTRQMTAGSTFKLPLNLYYYEQEWAGQITADTRIGGVKLSDCRFRTLVWSDNDIAIDMLYRIGSFRTYKDAMLRYFTIAPEQVPTAYYTDNNYSTAMMLDALKYLYERADAFSEMLGYMKQAQPENYFRLHVREYDIAHKYGFFEGAVNDVGIVYTPQPFLLAVFTQDVDGEEVVARACEALTDYTVAQYEQSLPPDPPQVPAEAPPPADPPQTTQPSTPPPAAPVEQTPQETAEPSVEQTVNDNLWWMILIAASIFLVGDLVVLFAMKRRSPAQFYKAGKKRRGK